ncbi:MAG: antitoxin [Planctomycetota bacterium]
MESVVFQNGNSLAVRLLGECRLPKGTRVREYRDGNRIIIEPVAGWPQSFLDALGAWDETIPRPDAPVRDPFAGEAE